MQSSFRSIEVVSGPRLLPTLGWAALAVFAQTVFARELTVRGAVPSFVTIVLVLYTVRAGLRRGALVGMLAGVLEDSFSGGGGAWTIADTLVAVAVGLVARGFFSDGFLTLAALVGLAIIVRDALYWTVMYFAGYPTGYALAHEHAALWQALLTALAALGYLIARTRWGSDRTSVERHIR